MQEHRNLYITEGLNTLADEIHEWATRKGFWDKERNFGEMIALQHSELSEALEAERHGNPPDDKCPELDSVSAEFADTIIRILDTCAARDIDIEKAIQMKMAYNEGRPFMHGKKF